MSSSIRKKIFLCVKAIKIEQKVCIAPASLSNYKIIFSGYATIKTTHLTHSTKALFDNYPNKMIHLVT